jgi:hypothetical protein
MQASNAPSKVPLPFANAGAKNTIPTASQIGVTPGAASLTDGFPPLTRTPIAAGGVPPSGQDMNGILYLLSANTQWECAGGLFTFDATFSTAVGGYPKGAILSNAAGNGLWYSTVDNNTVNPDTVGTGWIALATLPQVQQNYAWNHGFQVITATGNFTVPANTYFLKYKVTGAGAGAGGVGATSNGGAGGAGAGGMSTGILAVVPGQVIPCVIGAPGGGGGPGGTGGVGGTTTLNSTISATGGSPSTAPGVGGSNGGSSGSGTGGTANYAGGTGSAGGASISGSSATGGAGGAAPLGGAGGGSGSGVGGGGQIPGGGAGGGGNASATTGASGARGEITLEW